MPGDPPSTTLLHKWCTKFTKLPPPIFQAAYGLVRIMSTDFYEGAQLSIRANGSQEGVGREVARVMFCWRRRNT